MVQKEAPTLNDDGSIDHCLSAAREGSGEALGRLFDKCHEFLLLIANQELDTELRRKVGASDIVQ